MKGEKGAFVMMPDGDVMNVGHELEMKERCKQQGHSHTNSFFSAFPYIIKKLEIRSGHLKIFPIFYHIHICSRSESGLEQVCIYD